MRKNGGVGTKPQRKFFEASTLALHVIEALFGTKMVLEKDKKLANFMSYEWKSLSDFAIDELYPLEKRKAF